MTTDWDSKQSKLAQTFLPCGPIFFWQWLFRQQDKDLHDLIYDDVISSCGWSWNHKLPLSLWFSQQISYVDDNGSVPQAFTASELAHEHIAIIIAPSQSINLPSSSRNAFCCAHVESRLLQNWAFTFPNRPSTTAFLNRSTTTDFLSFVERNTRRPIKPWTILVHHFNLPLWACREFASDRA